MESKDQTQPPRQSPKVWYNPRLWRNLGAMVGVMAIGVGLWWERPSVCLVVLGALVAAGSLIGIYRVSRTEVRK